MARLLLDTNVIIDFFDAAREHHEVARQLVELAVTGGHDLCVATTTCKDAYYVLSRLQNEAAARECVLSMFIAMDLLPVDAKTAYEAFHSDEPDFEDGIIRMCAELNHMDYLVTRDEGAFKDVKTHRVAPEDILAFLRS